MDMNEYKLITIIIQLKRMQIHIVENNRIKEKFKIQNHNKIYRR